MRIRYAALFFSLTLPCLPAHAYEPPPIEQGALARGFALPGIGRSDVLLEGQWQQQLALTSTNEYKKQIGTTDSIVVDGEVSKFTYQLNRGLGADWDVGVSVPFLIQGGGYLDGLIESWHSTFNLPNAGREQVPKNRYAYQYMQNGQLLLDDRRSSNGLGDSQISVGHLLTDGLAIRAMLKLPTGKSSTLAGNGAFGGALWLDGHIPDVGKWLLGGGLGISYTETGDILSTQQNNWLPVAAIELGYNFTSRLAAQVQIYLHGAPYRSSALLPLASVAVPLTVSGSYQLSKTLSVLAGFQEKVIYGASPDFGIFLALNIR